MKPYPKNIYQTAALIQKYKDAGLVITDDQKVETALNEIGFYRLRGYSFHLYDNATKKYIPNVAFDTICHIYNFDMELRSLLFGMTCKIEVALRSRFCEALLQKNDALIYLDPSIFKDKAIFWRNTASISSEIARSTDVFITHNYDNHDGQIPLWAAVEVMSFGTLSKYMYRDPLRLLAMGYTNREIAKSLGLTDEVVRTRLFRGRKPLWKEMNSHE